MGLDERSVDIANAFLKFIETRDKTLVENFTREEIEAALFEFHSDRLRELPYYKAMRTRIAELKDSESREREGERWRDRLTGLLLGLVLALIIILVRRYLL